MTHLVSAETGPAMLPIREIADRLEIPDHYLDYYGRYTAKLRLELLQYRSGHQGKLILVTAITPTSHGEGKTVVSIGLAQALDQIGRRAVVTLREPSLGPVFGIKGGATGGGKSRVMPSELINLHFNGDIHAVSAAHNLLTVTDAYLAAGAGFIVVVAGNMMLMPGLSKEPQAMKMDVDEQGNVIGLV